MSPRRVAERLFPVLLFCIAACARNDSAELRFPELEKIAREFDIEILAADAVFPVRTMHGMIDGRTAETNATRDYARLFAAEFSLYPPDLVKRTRLKRVVLCTALSFAGQLRNAIPDFEHDTLYLDVSRGAYDKTYLRKVIHHEFFHIIDYCDDGKLYQDERWAAINPTSFTYGTGGSLAQDRSNTSVLTTKFPGFLNHYSTTAVEEDKAEVFANLIVDCARVAARSETDGVLHAKVQLMKELMAAFCPEMSDQFWQKARALNRTGD